MKCEDLNNFTNPSNVQTKLLRKWMTKRKSTGRPNIKQSEKHIDCKLTGTEKRRRHKEPTLPIGSPTGTYGQDPVGGTEKPGTKNRLTSTLVSVWPTISSLPMVFKCFTAINFFFFFKL